MDERINVSVRDIMNVKADDMTPSQRAQLPRDFVSYKPKLYTGLSAPSYVHGYSLAIEYMKSWFVSKFPKDYFKVIHVNGKHVLDDWKHFNNYNIKREKPMLAIVPTVDYDFDREFLDTYMADQNLFLKRTNYQQSFVKDYDNMIFLYMNMEALRMNFNFKVRVNSRSEQLDLLKKMQLWFRVGATQYQYISTDFHIPYDIMLNIAKDAAFEINPDNTIKDTVSFLSYINSHSDLPVMFKMRAINQKPEFFVRARNLYTHISCRDKINVDDGERDGKLDTNFHLEFQVTLTIPVPQFFVYFAQVPIAYTIAVQEDKTAVGIYSINSFEIPVENELGWGQMVVTEYMCEEDEKSIDLSEIFTGDGNINKVMRHSLNSNISPSSFIEVKIYHGDDIALRVNCNMDYEKLTLYLLDNVSQNEMLKIAIYADKKYVNDAIVMLENYDNSRIAKETN